MARRALSVTITTLTTTAALLLAGCGGGGGGGDSSAGDIKGAGSGAGSASPSASASASAASQVTRPVITLPSSFQLTFESWTSSDAKEQAVLDDAKEELRAGYAAIIANDPDSEALAFYDTENGRSQSSRWIKSYTDKNVTVIGKLPAFDPKVTLVDSGDGRTASLRYCTDESKAYTKNRKTGAVVGNPEGTAPEVGYLVTLRKSAQGVWQNDSVTAKRGECAQ